MSSNIFKRSWVLVVGGTSNFLCGVHLIEVVVDEQTGLRRYPFPLEPIPRLHWEDAEADHRMTHEVKGEAQGKVLETQGKG